MVWLKLNNIYYKNIEIDEEIIKQLPINGNISNELQCLNIDTVKNTQINSSESNNLSENYDNTLVESNIPDISIINQDQRINKELNLDYPTLDNDPINEFTTEGYIACAFPHLFPQGIADFSQTREIKVTLDQYFKHLMKYKDKRFAQDPRFRFFALNTIMRHGMLQKAGIYINKSKLQECTVEELKNKLQNDKNFWKHIMVYSSKIRSTNSYWYQRCDELITMVKQLKKSTIFFTLSAADHQWNELYKLLCPNEDPNTIDDKKTIELIRNNPLIVGYFFKIRVESFMKHVIKPLFHVTDFWYRWEWQFRGSPHIHGILWLSDAPLLNYNNLSQEEIQTMCSYFDNFCFAINPRHDIGLSHPSRENFSDINKNELMNDLIYLLNRLQRHTVHGKHCMRYKYKSKDFTCRFNFPQPLREKSSIDNSDGYLRYHPKRNDPLLQRYNPVVTSIWRANTDFSPIVSEKAVYYYIANYASKSEKISKDLQECLKEICNSMSDNLHAKTAIQKLFISTLCERDYSAQEVIHLLMSWPLYHSSRTYITLVVQEEDWSPVEVLLKIIFIIYITIQILMHLLE